MEPARLIHGARRRTGLTLRALAARAGTSHSTLSAYETGAKVPTIQTLRRILAATEHALRLEATPQSDDHDHDRGAELVAVLELAGNFPARHGANLDAPPFPRRPR